MVKKRRHDATESGPPEFDEREFVRRELLDSKLAFIVMVFAVSMGAVSGAIYAVNDAGRAAAAGLVGVAGMLAIPFLFRLLGIDLRKEFVREDARMKEDERKSEVRGYLMKVLGQVGIYFFIWLAVFVLAVNTPFVDNSAPAIMMVKAKMGSEDWHPLSGGKIEIPTNTTSGKRVTLSAKVTDNTGVSNVSFTVDGTPMKDITRKGDVYSTEVPPNSPMSVQIDATDTLGHTSSQGFKIIIVIE